MTRNHVVNIFVGMAVMAISACDRPVEKDVGSVDEGAAPTATSGQTACLDPATGELIQPGPGVECSVPHQAQAAGEPVVRDLEGGGKVIDLEGKFDKNQVAPAAPNRIAVFDKKTGELVTQRPSDAKAAVRYDRSIARARAVMRMRSTQQSLQALEPEALSNGGFKIDLQGQFQVPLVAKLSKDGQIHLRHQDQ